jgi:hypothetical protein
VTVPPPEPGDILRRKSKRWRGYTLRFHFYKYTSDPILLKACICICAGLCDQRAKTDNISVMLRKGHTDEIEKAGERV